MTEQLGVLDSYHLSETLRASARKLGERCAADAVDMLAQRLREYIGSPEDDKYSYVWRSAIETHEQDAHNNQDLRSILVDGLRDAALGATAASSPDAPAIARSLLQSSYPTLTRVGIHLCGERYETVGSAFWDCVREDWFIDASYWHELFWFINKAFGKFSAKERSKFLELVDHVTGDWIDESRQIELDESHRRDILHAAHNLGDTEVDRRYQALVQRWGPVRDHPDFHSYSVGGWIGDKSPLPSDALAAMSAEELVTFLNSFAPDRRGWDGPSYRGLASSITAAVRVSEDGFASRIGLFGDLPRPYQHGLLRGLKERWSDDKRHIDWPATISLLQTIVSSPTFKEDLASDKPEGWEPSVHWVVSDISDLIKSAAATERSLPVNQLAACLQLLSLVLEICRPGSVAAEHSNDAVSHSINFPRGRALEAFVHVALALKRAEVAAGSGPSTTWAIVVPVFEAELALSEAGLNAEFSTIAGMYCTNFHYLNPDWTKSNFNRLFSTTNEAAWQCAAQGFAYQRHLYEWLFRCLVEGGHLRRMIYTEGLPDQVAEKALQFLGLAYLEGIEVLDGGGLLNELVAKLQVKELSQLCWFYWTLRGKAASDVRASRILNFWMKVAEQIQTSASDAPALQSALSQLAVFVNELTPATIKALKDAAPHAQISHHGYMLVQNLSRLASRYPREVAAIFRAAICGFLPEYRKEDVIECVNQLAEAGEIEEAESICNAYAERGSGLLKETYEALRARQRATGGA